MRYLVLPRTNLTVSVLCLGTDRFGTAIEQAQAFRLLDNFFAAGGNFVDTAHVYADWVPGAPKCASEKTIGRWLKAGNHRHEIVIATKGGHPDLATLDRPRLSRAELQRDLDESLTCLQTDSIDLYWLHRDDPSIPAGELIEWLHEQTVAGKIRCFGCSNWRAERIREAIDYAVAHDLPGFVANQPEWSLAVPNPSARTDPLLVPFDRAAFDLHRQTGLAVIPYSAQAKGFFSKLEAQGAEGLPEEYREAYDSETNRRRFERARRLAQKYAVSINQIALAYLLGQPFTTVPVIGSRTLEQLDDSLKAADLRLTPEEINELQGGDAPFPAG